MTRVKCDIIADDPYYDYSKRSKYDKDPANAKRFGKTYKTSPNKMIMMSENDYIPDPDKAFEQNTKWLSFATWCREFVCDYTDGETHPVYKTEKSNTAEELKAIYANPKVLSLEDIQEHIKNNVYHFA